MIKEVHVVKGAPQLKSVSLHNGSVMGVTMTDEIIILGYLSVSKEPTLYVETQQAATKPRRGRPKMRAKSTNGADANVETGETRAAL